jgi:hypothetical protein
MPYTKTNENNETIFHVTPEQAPSLLNALILPLLLPFIILFAINIFIFLLAVAVIGIWIYFNQKSDNVTRYRNPSVVSVSQNGLSFNNTFYKKEDIHRLIIRNHVNDQYVFVPARLSYEQPGNVDRGLKLRQKLIAVSYRVDMEIGGKPYTLAGGINEPTAYALLKDISRIMEFDIK